MRASLCCVTGRWAVGGADAVAGLRFLRLGYQCPWSHWFREQCMLLAAGPGHGLEDVDLTGRPGLAAPFQAYSSAQLVVPNHPPFPTPLPYDILKDTFTRPWPQEAVAPTPPRPAAPAGTLRVFRPEDGPLWTAAVAKTVGLCLGDPRPGMDPAGAVAAKLAWLEGLASSECRPLVCLAGDPPVAFLELIPAEAAHVPLPGAGTGDLFLTCIHGATLPRDERPWLLAGVLDWLSTPSSGWPIQQAKPSVWAVCGRRAAYPNGPSCLFTAAGFVEVMDLGRIWLIGGWDELVLVNWQPPGQRQGSRALEET